jgi:hypothetical protein
MTLVSPRSTDTRNEPRASERIVNRISARLSRGVTRRSFLAKTAIVGSALAVNPLRYLLRPGTAYASLCGPAADCGSGWTAMCCTVNGGENTCPPGSIPAGWWKADNSGFCGGSARYYIDCNGHCGSCGCGSSGICGPGCYNCGCRCASGTCDQRRTCCNQFRYGQCHQELACVGAIVCRVVTCTPPWQFDPTCSTASATSNTTALHDAPCLHDGASTAHVYAYAGAVSYGEPQGRLLAPVVGMDATATGKGYWLVASDGGVFAFGDAVFRGSMGGTRLNKPIVDLAHTPAGKGYWMVASDGGIFAFGDAVFRGSTGSMRLNQPIVGMAGTPSGKGYWLVASDGGIFCFGDAAFRGSTGSIRLNKPIVGMAATPTGKGYWLIASDGGVFCFGDAVFKGSLGSLRLVAPITGAAATPTGKGYWMVARDGGVFAFGDARFFGSLGADGSVKGRNVGLTPTPAGDGYWISTSS